MCVLCSLVITWFKSIVIPPFLFWGMKIRGLSVCRLLRIYSFVWPHVVWTSFAYYLFDSHERFACPKAPHTSYISTSFYKWKTTKQHGSLWNLFLYVIVRYPNERCLFISKYLVAKSFLCATRFFFQNAIFFLLYEITK